ncbi:MAG: GNAT family N-acetyltransferase [Halioglobus sp.]
MKCHRYSAYSELPERCHDLIAETSSSNLFLSDLWFRNLIDFGLEQNASLEIFEVENPSLNQTLALLFLRSPAGQNGSRFGHFGNEQRSLASMTNFQTSFYSPVVSDKTGDLNAVVSVFAAEIAEPDTGLWYVIDFNLMDQEGPVYQALSKSLGKAGYRCYSYFYKGNWFEAITSDTFSEYLAGRTSKNRKQIQNYKRKLRKLERSFDVSATVLTTVNDLEKIHAAYQSVYSASWKEDDYFPAFYPELINKCAANGSLRFLVISVDGKTVAFEFAVVTGLQCVFMRTAYDPQYRRDSIGSIAIMKMIEHVIDVDGVSEIDFGTDDDSYKGVWLSNRRERYGLVCFNENTFRGRILKYLFVTGRFKEVALEKVKSLIGFRR